MFGIGKQYDLDYSFKKKARLHQSKFRSEILRVDFNEYGNRLPEAKAKSGLNFFDGLNIFDSVKKRFPKYSKGLYSDMLRSEHIPFNVFIPLKANTELARHILSSFIPFEINEITDIKIEFSPAPAENYLNDRTAFDTFIEYRNSRNEYGIIGVEVKYSEQEYYLKQGSKEEKDIQNQNSIYYQLTNSIEIYKPEKIIELPKDRYRQIWRNQLLGESMIVKEDSKYSEFTSVILYPAGNIHFTEVSSEYKKFLLSSSFDRFIAITFESFFKLIENNIDSFELRNWLGYLKDRYLFE